MRAPPPTELEPENVSNARLPAQRVLVVEDDPASLSFLQFALAKHGYDVFAAEDADSAEAQLAAAGLGAFQCVVADYRMPERTGLELLAWIKGWDPTLATIIVTAESEQGLVKQSLRGGAADFLDKPVDADKYRAAVQRAVQHTQRQRRMAESETAVRELGAPRNGWSRLNPRTARCGSMSVSIPSTKRAVTSSAACARLPINLSACSPMFPDTIYKRPMFPLIFKAW